MNAPHHPSSLAIALYLDGYDAPDQAPDGTWLTDDDFLVLVNAWWEPLGFTLPETRPEAEWQLVLDSHRPQDVVVVVEPVQSPPQVPARWLASGRSR